MYAVLGLRRSRLKPRGLKGAHLSIQALPLNACLQSRAPMGKKRTGKPAIPRTPPKRQRASKHLVEVALRVCVGDITAAPTRPPRPVLRDPSPMKYGCEPHGILRQHDRRTVSGKAPCSFEIHRPAAADALAGVEGEDTSARNRRACSLQPRQPNEAVPKTVMSATREGRRREGLCECRRRAVFQPPTPTWTVGATADLEVLCGKANNSPANAAYGICTRCPVLKKPVGGASGLGGGGGIGNRNRATGNSEHLRRGDATRT